MIASTFQHDEEVTMRNGSRTDQVVSQFTLWNVYVSSREVSEHWLFVLGFTAYITVILPLVKYRKSEALGRPFYRICISLAVTDMVVILYEEVLLNILKLENNLDLCK